MVPVNTAIDSLPPRHPATQVFNSWVVCAAAILFGLASLYMAAIKRQTHSLTVKPVPAATPVPVIAVASIPVLIQPAPRAEPVTGPLGADGQPMLSGHQYYINMPDGRHLLVNYKGYVPHASDLPRQHGINNAMYTDAATGVDWIWTVPATGPNVPQWIDP